MPLKKESIEQYEKGLPKSYLASLEQMRRTVDFESSLASSTSHIPRQENHMTATSVQKFTGIKFLRDSTSDPSRTWTGSYTSKKNNTDLIQTSVCKRDWVESCVGSWLGKGFDSDLNPRQMQMLKIKNQALPYNKPIAKGGYNRAWRSRVAKLAIQDVMARKLQGQYRFYDVKKRMRLGGEFNVQQALEYFEDEQFEEAIHCLDTANSFFSIQRNKLMQAEVDRLRKHIKVVQRAEDEMVRARACLYTEDPPLEIVRASLEIAEQLILELPNRKDDDHSRLNEVYFLRANTNIQIASKFIGDTLAADLELAQSRLDEAEQSLSKVNLDVVTHEEKVEGDIKNTKLNSTTSTRGTWS